MNSFRTEIFPEKSPLQINYKSHILLIGSCFAQNIGDKLNNLGFYVITNPFGVLYNPLSVNNAFDILISCKRYKKEDVFFNNGLWHSFDHHSNFSDIDAEMCIDKINETIFNVHESLTSVNTVIITLGTSWVYKLKSSGNVVANCHKIPAREFERYFAKADEVEQSIINMVEKLRKTNPDIQFIFTVSPIRHWKDGAAGNMLSKSNLIVAIHNAIQKQKNCVYFPSFEIMMDDLRDYRFYKEDMLHPSDQAIEYIWKKFKEMHLNKNVYSLIDETEKLIQAALHKPFNTSLSEYKKFIKTCLEKATKLQTEHSVRLENLIQKFESIIQ